MAKPPPDFCCHDPNLAKTTTRFVLRPRINESYAENHHGNVVKLRPDQNQIVRSGYIAIRHATNHGKIKARPRPDLVLN